jgi:hypothetical protein
MCFCAGASFAASAGLAVIGIAAQRLVTTPHQRMFATIPLLFAMQQAAEGIVWLTVNNPEYKMLTLIGVYTFLTYAFIVWPFWIPFSVSLMERTRKRKSLLQGISLLGAGISLFLGWLLVKYGAQASIINHSVYYDVARPRICRAAYLLICVYYNSTIFYRNYARRSPLWFFNLGFFYSSL